MNNGEFEPQAKLSFVDVARELSEDKGMFLSHHSAKIVDQYSVVEEIPIHYKDLNGVIEKGAIRLGKGINGQLFEAARRLLAEEKHPKVGPAYPILSVVNHATGATESRVIDIPELIVRGKLPVYSAPSRSKNGGELITADFSPLAEDLAYIVGIEPEAAIINDRNESLFLTSAHLVSRLHLKKSYDIEGYDCPVEINTRGAAALSLLQMQVAQEFAESRHRLVHTSGGKVEVELRVETRPDIQTYLLELIDVARDHDMQLYYHKDYIATGELGHVLAMVDKDNREVASLAGGSMLHSVVYDAYHAAVKMFK